MVTFYKDTFTTRYLAILVGYLSCHVIYSAFQPVFVLPKAEWVCTQTKVETKNAPILVEGSTVVIPINTAACVKFQKKEP
jgi:hypothetical protein